MHRTSVKSPMPTGLDTGCPVTARPATVKMAWRNSLARHALRLSLSQPAIAQAQSLPHANDGHPNTAPTSRSHSWRTSVDSVPRSCLSHGHAMPPALFVLPRRRPPTTTSTACGANVDSSATPYHTTHYVSQATPAYPQHAFRSLDTTAPYQYLRSFTSTSPRLRSPLHTSDTDLRAHRAHRPRRRFPSSRW